MLQRTFVHLPRVGYQTEQRLWQQGLADWESALGASHAPAGFSASRWREACGHLEASRYSLGRREHRFFARALASADHWRAWPDFADRTAYLDIETTGCGLGACVTVVGVWDGRRMRSYVAGDNLDALPEEIEQYALLVTFNGATFDLPFLRRRFPAWPPDLLHVDLRYALAHLGLRGGLKALERRCGLAREDDLEGLGGEDAVRLWFAHRAGSEAALDLLVRYNAADVQNLEPLMQLAHRRLSATLFPACAPGGEPSGVGAERDS